jgi:hypothetical protein
VFTHGVLNPRQPSWLWRQDWLAHNLRESQTYLFLALTLLVVKSRGPKKQRACQGLPGATGTQSSQAMEAIWLCFCSLQKEVLVQGQQLPWL